MKKIFILAITAVMAIGATAQSVVKKAMEDNQATIEAMNEILLKDYTMMTTAYKAVSGRTLEMGECVVLGSYVDEGFKKQCKTLQDEFGGMFLNSKWTFDKFNPNAQSIVKVSTKKGQTEQSPYSGFDGDATISIGSLIQGLTIQAYFYESKADKNKYIMFFIMQQKGVFIEMTVKDGKSAAKEKEVKEKTSNDAGATEVKDDAKTTANNAAGTETKVPPIKKPIVNNQAKNKLANAVKGKLIKN
jgi:hypothetical protein